MPLRILSKRGIHWFVLDIMLEIGLWGTIYNIVYMFDWPRGGGFKASRFFQELPEAAWDILMYCLCRTVSQYFIFLTISYFGSLSNTIITTTRKFMNIVVECLYIPQQLGLWSSSQVLLNVANEDGRGSSVGQLMVFLLIMCSVEYGWLHWSLFIFFKYENATVVIVNQRRRIMYEIGWRQSTYMREHPTVAFLFLAAVLNFSAYSFF